MNQLIVVFSKRVKIGLTAMPYHADVQNTDPIVLHEQVHSAHIDDNPAQFSDAEKEVIQLLSRVSDQSLFKKFSREKSLKDFKDNIPDKIMEERIRPDLEKTMYRLIHLLIQHPIPAYFRSDGYSQLYHADRIKIHTTQTLPVFHFDLREGTLRYTLKLKQDDTVFAPAGKKTEVICHHPAVLKINQEIFHFADFDSAKIKPFLNKLSINIPQPHLKTYMEGFVANCIRHHEVNGNGFTIENITDAPGSFLILEKNLKQQPVLNLYFKYANHRFLADRKIDTFVDVLHNSDGYSFRKIARNFESEKKTFQIIQQLGLTQSGDASFSYPDGYLPDNLNGSQGPEGLVEWVRENKDVLAENQIETVLKYEGKTFSQTRVINHFRSQETTDWFELNTIIEIPPHKIPFVRFRKYILKGNRHFPLPDGEIFIIPREWFTRYADLFNFGEEEDNTLKIKKVHFHLIEEVSDLGAGTVPPTIHRTGSDAHIPLPKGLTATLRPYQTDGYQWLNLLYNSNFGGILADDMGLGKTVQTIALLLRVFDKNLRENPEMKRNDTQLSLFPSAADKGFNKTGVPPALIVMPTSLVHNWAAEFDKFAPTLKVYNFTGANRARSFDVWRIFRHYHVVLTTYGILRNDVQFFKDYQFQYLILDESQNIKNPASKSFKAVKEVTARHHLVLTGTPVENSLVDLWAQMNVVNKDLLGSLGFFQKHYVTPITKDEHAEKSEQLQRLIRPFLLRRTKEMVVRDLPPLTEQVVYCDMTPEQKKFYEREKSGIRNAIFEALEHENSNKKAILALKSLTRLRQIANHPATVKPDFEGGSGKFDQVLESMESIVSENHHILVFSSFVKDLKLMEEELIIRKIHYAKLTGATANRQEVIESFNRDDRCKVFLISLKAGGVGLNLTKADYVFMLNPWWNPAAEAHAITRAHRIGQERNVFVYRFISTETVEEKIARLQEKKSALSSTFVKSNNPLSNMSTEEIKELFS